MAEYIEREAATELLKQRLYETALNSTGFNADAGDVFADAADRLEKTWINEIPAADVRPVVYCKDCKWYQIDELKKDGTEDRRYKPSVCVLAEQRREPNHFCADGEKREKS